MKTKTRKIAAKKPASKKRSPIPAKVMARKKKPIARKKAAHPTVRRLPAKPSQWSRWAVGLAWLMPAIAGVVITLAYYQHVPAKPAAPKYAVEYTSAHLVQMYEQTQKLDLGERIAFWSNALRENPRLLAPLGRGPVTADTVPVFPSEYDCTTFVETVAALSRSRSLEYLADSVIAIRYGSDLVEFDTRNHFPEADWIPNNETRGYLKDLTVQISRETGILASYVHKDINRAVWLARQKDRPGTRAIAANHETHTVKLAYIPLDSMEKALKYIPQGSVLNVVRENRQSIPVLISHQGFLVWKDGVAYFRHASRDRAITDTPLMQYLGQLKGHPWRVVGFNVNTFNG